MQEEEEMSERISEEEEPQDVKRVKNKEWREKRREKRG